MSFVRLERKKEDFYGNAEELLLKEQERLEQILEKAKVRLKDAPQGKLRLSSCRENVQYYHCTQGARKNGSYIPKEQMELIRRLAQKSYDEKIIRTS